MALSKISGLSQRVFTSASVNCVRNKSLWTTEKIVKSPHRDVIIPNRTVTEHIWEKLEKWADKTAIICSITNRSYTYHQLYKYSRNFAAKLRGSMQIRDGDVVCIMMSNSPEYPIAVLGALEAGAEVTTVNPIYTAHEVQRQLTLSRPKILVGIPETISVLREALNLSITSLPIIVVNCAENTELSGCISFKELAFDDTIDKSILKEVKRNKDDIAFLPYSSGTTGLPKGVELTNKNIVVNCIQQDVETVKHYDDTTNHHQASVLAILPFYHIYGLSIVMLHKLSVGIKVVTMPKFHPQTFLSAFEKSDINILYAAPPLILFLASHKDVTKKKLEKIKTITSGAAPLPRNDIDRVIEKLQPGTNFLQLYGLTETSPLATAMLPGSTDFSTSGLAISNTELRIVDGNNRSLGPDEIGELLIRGPQVMKGYRNDMENTKAAFTGDRWFKSGDLASINSDGVITIADRLKELIKVKGYQVPPAELESVLKSHPDVLDAAVVGVPDPRMGEVPKAFVVLNEGRKTVDKEIIEFVSKRVAEYKRIKEVTFLDALPKNASGKLLRRELKKLYC
ncbi:hypothetical protein K1T71_008152 [Dendrolimus kikuchii]|uniref:Uncharacterized protein n=1 Tax=Dendrolimus kikuchii TaxID=765133 RepID=A0ACC1CXB7_9NEOP|nr:hypothetical protein K1T71_008152 [Dendrolimus kikuchii]